MAKAQIKKCAVYTRVSTDMQAEKVDFVLTYKIDRLTRSLKEYNQVGPYSALDYRPPAPEAIVQLTLT